MLRAEAEREFAKTRLPTLHIEWRFCGGQSFDRGSVTSGEIQSFSDNDVFATFSASFTIFAREHMENRVEARSRVETVTSALRYLDRDLRYRTARDHAGAAYMRQQCLLGEVYNDIQIPSLTVDLDAATFTFEWRNFLNEFYRDSAYVQKRERLIEASQYQDSVLPDSSDSVDESLAAHFCEWSKCTSSIEGGGECSKSGSILEQPSSWSENFGIEDDGLYTEAYLHRLKRSYALAGWDIDYEHVVEGMNTPDLWNWVEQQVVSHRRERNLLLFHDYKKRQGFHAWISDNGTFVPLFCCCNSSGSPRYAPISPRFSPLQEPYSTRSHDGFHNFWDRGSISPGLSPYHPITPHYSPTSPPFPISPPRFSATSPRDSPDSPRYSPTSPLYSPDSPWYSRNSPLPTFYPTSPQYSPTSPQYSPNSPLYSPSSALSPWTPTSFINPLNFPAADFTQPPPIFHPASTDAQDDIIRDDTSYYDPPTDDENCGVEMTEDSVSQDV
jgi:hypothetical protein